MTVLALLTGNATASAKNSDVNAVIAAVNDLAARVAALEGQVTANVASIADLATSDDASGWKAWRLNKKAHGS